jgi:hypothetical protein
MTSSLRGLQAEAATPRQRPQQRNLLAGGKFC